MIKKISYLMMSLIAVGIMGGVLIMEKAFLGKMPVETVVRKENVTGVKREEFNSLILVNKDHPLPEDYEPDLLTLDNGEQVDTRIYPKLQQMFDAMRAEGIYPTVTSGYRSRMEQRALMNKRILKHTAEGMLPQKAKKEAEKFVALPGTSEHETGLAVDINGDMEHAQHAEVHGWLKMHAAEYGFIKRYPEDKISLTEIDNEPWHYRYVGKEAAMEMRIKDLCLEEYLLKE